MNTPNSFKTSPSLVKQFQLDIDTFIGYGGLWKSICKCMSPKYYTALKRPSDDKGWVWDGHYFMRFCTNNKYKHEEALEQYLQLFGWTSARDVKNLGNTGLDMIKFRQLGKATALSYGIPSLKLFIDAYVKFCSDACILNDIHGFRDNNGNIRQVVRLIDNKYESFEDVLKTVKVKPPSRGDVQAFDNEEPQQTYQHQSTLRHPEIKADTNLHTQQIIETAFELKQEDEKMEDYPFKTHITGCLKNYFQRKKSEQKIEDYFFSEEHNNGFFLVEGDPGTGKSTFFSKVVNDFRDQGQKINCIWYVNDFSADDNRVMNFMECFFKEALPSYELDRFYDRYQHEIVNGKSLRGRLFQDVLVHISNKIENENLPPLAIAIDALDEVHPHDPTRNGNILNIPSETPPHIYFFITSRFFDHQSYYELGEKIVFKESDPDHRDEVFEYIQNEIKSERIHNWIICRGSGDKDKFITSLCEKSEYSFIYLKYVFENIEALESIEDLPKGIKGYYFRQLERILFKDERETINRSKSKILALAAIKRFHRISPRRLSYFCGFTTPEEAISLIQSWLDIRVVQEEDDSLFIVFYHKSFYDYLEESEQAICKRIRQGEVDLTAHQCLANQLNHEISLKEHYVELSDCLNYFERDETFKIVIEVYKQGNKAEWLADLVTHHGFFSSALEHYSKQELIRAIEASFKIYQNSGKTQEMQNEFGIKTVNQCYGNLIFSKPELLSREDFKLVFNQRDDGIISYFNDNYPSDFEGLVVD